MSAFASGTRAQSRLIASYALTNLTDRPLSLRLVLAVRPFQVNPPSQFLSTTGGVSAIHDVRWDGTALTINDNRQVFPLRAPDRAGMFPSDAGAIPKLLAAADWGQSEKVHDDIGYASAALGYDLRLAPRASTQVAIVLPLSGTAVRPRLDGQPPRTWVAREQNAVAAMWRDEARSGFAARPGEREAACRHAAHCNRPHSDHPRRPDPSSRNALVRALVDSRRHHDRGIAAAPRSCRRRGGLSALVCPVSVRKRQGSVLRR